MRRGGHATPNPLIEPIANPLSSHHNLPLFVYSLFQSSHPVCPTSFTLSDNLRRANPEAMGSLSDDCNCSQAVESSAAPSNYTEKAEEEPGGGLVHRIYASFCPRECLAGSDNNPKMSNWIEAYDPVHNLWSRAGSIPGLADEEMLKGFAMAAVGKDLYIIGGRLCCKSDIQNNEEGIHINTSININADDANINVASEIDLRVREEVYKYDCVDKNWVKCASLQSARVDFACAVYDGKIYVAGGRAHASQEKGVSCAEVYDPRLDEWTALPNMSTGRYKCVGATRGNKIHVIGGFAGPEDSDTILPYTTDRSSVEVYDPEAGRWDLVQGMWQLDVPPNQIVTVNNRFYSSGDCLNAWKGHIEAYDDELNMWKIVDGSHLRNMSRGRDCDDGGQHERLYLTMAAIGDRLYFLGGFRLPFESNRCLSTVHVFDTSAARQWRNLEPSMEDLCKELCSHCCVVAI